MDTNENENGSHEAHRLYRLYKYINRLTPGLYKYSNHLTPGFAEVSASGCGLHLLLG